MTEIRDPEESVDRYLARRAAQVNGSLGRYVPEESTRPATLHRAMRYSLLAGGKRLRPILTLAAGEACGGHEDALVPVACALEMIHTYSLIHDDLPAMDNDDLRRGKPTCHRVFGEAMAILAGDALLTQAFLVLATAPVPDGARSELVHEVAAASGAADGMVGGQTVDIESEGREVSLDDLGFIHRAKTGALIRASIVAGGLAAGAEPDILAALRTYGERIGLAFQIADDLLDLSATEAELGKTPGKDVAAQKATFPALLGVEASRAQADRLIDEAIDALLPLGSKAGTLDEIARFVVSRRT